MNARHPEGFIEQALVKVYTRGERTVRSVAEDLNVNYHTLKSWMKSKKGYRIAQRNCISLIAANMPKYSRTSLILKIKPGWFSLSH